MEVPAWKIGNQIVLGLSVHTPFFEDRENFQTEMQTSDKTDKAMKNLQSRKAKTFACKKMSMVRTITKMKDICSSTRPSKL